MNNSTLETIGSFTIMFFAVSLFVSNIVLLDYVIDMKDNIPCELQQVYLKKTNNDCKSYDELLESKEVLK